jgi:hypothetical protein
MKKYLGYFMVIIAILPVAAFLGIHEMAFFNNTFSEDNQSMAPLGYMLTGGGVFVWIGILLWNAKSGLQKAISLIMIVVCVIGALSAALFNMYMVTMEDAGFMLTKNEIKSMTLLIGILAIMHMIALIMELAGEHIIQAWNDDDGDGIPNFLDRHDNRKQTRTFAGETKKVDEKDFTDPPRKQ